MRAATIPQPKASVILPMITGDRFAAELSVVTCRHCKKKHQFCVGESNLRDPLFLGFAREHLERCHGVDFAKKTTAR